MKVGALGPLHTRPFQAPSAFSLKYSHFELVSSSSNDLQTPVHREQEAAQTLLVPMASNGLGEKSESAAFLSRHALGLSLVS